MVEEKADETSDVDPPMARSSRWQRLRLPNRTTELFRRARVGPRPALLRGVWWSAGRAAIAASLVTLIGTLLLFVALSLLGTRLGPGSQAVELAMPDHPPSQATAPPAVGIDGGIVVSPYTAAAFAGVPALPPGKGEGLAPAPDPALIEITAAGSLPRIGADGRQSRLVYARPFAGSDRRARLSIIVLDIGLSRIASDASIKRLPGAVVLAVDAYAASPEEWAQAARRAGHEVLTTIPLQPPSGTAEDAGPRALRPEAPLSEKMERLHANLARLTGSIGVLMQGDAGPLRDRMDPLLEQLRLRGLLLVDGTTTVGASPLLRTAGRLGLAHVPLNVRVDATDAPGIDRQLETLAAMALERSFAVGAIRPTPVALERLHEFLTRLDPARFIVAPVSAVVTVTGAG